MIEAILFVTGAAVMVLELVGSRILAPYVGISIFVWTSLIGVILGSLSLGYWLGGKRADKEPSETGLANIIFLSALSIFLLVFARGPVFNLFSAIEDVRIKAPLVALLLFSLPSILLAAVTPYALRLRMRETEKSGSLAGRLYGISTVGSIAGTFLAGFYLIPNFGTKTILIILGVVFSLIAAILRTKTLSKKKTLLILLFFLLAATAKENFGWLKIPRDSLVFAGETAYNSVLVFDSVRFTAGKSARFLITDPVGAQSAMFLGNDDEPVIEYTKFYRLAGHFVPNIKKALMIGGGGYSYPKDFIKNFPAASIDVVEIDPRITDIAKKYFKLGDDPRIITRNEDGRIFLNNVGGETYDAIFLDAFHGCTPPYHLGTREAAEKAYAALKKNGVFITNILGSVGGKNGEFLKREYTTYKSIFPWVYVFPVTKNNEYSIQNIMLVAVKQEGLPMLQSKNNEIAGYLNGVWRGKIEGGIVMTDDYAPAEYLLRSVCSKSMI